MLKMTGIAMSGIKAVEFLERLPDSIPNEIKDEEFCDEYKRMLNRVRYEVSRSVPVAPKIDKAQTRGHSDYYNCGECGAGVRSDIYKHCPKCGRAIKWSAVFSWMYP